jgi:hypothetical protein
MVMTEAHGTDLPNSVSVRVAVRVCSSLTKLVAVPGVRSIVVGTQVFDAVRASPVWGFAPATTRMFAVTECVVPATLVAVAGVGAAPRTPHRSAPRLG